MLRDRILVVELNPFHQGAGAGEFSWSKDRALFMNGPFEFSVLERPMPDVRKFIHPMWTRFIDQECGTTKSRSTSRHDSSARIRFFIVLSIVITTILAWLFRR